MSENKIVVEVLYPELCNLYGDSANVRYLKLCMPQAEFIETHINDKPRFLSEKISFVYMGACTERAQLKIIEELSPFKDEIKMKIEEELLFLFTGNALEVLGDYIETPEGKKQKALGVFNFYVKQNMLQRHNSECEAYFGDFRVLGFKTQFTMCYPKSDDNFFMAVSKGMGMNLKSKKEGIHYKNFMGTYIVGPILIMNPSFTKYILKLIMKKDTELPFEKEVVEAYNKRGLDFDKNVGKEPEKYRHM